MTQQDPLHVLQVMHAPKQPFLDLGRHYSAALESAGVLVTTVFLTGAQPPETESRVGSSEVIYLELPKKALRGMKIGAIREIARLCKRVRPRLIIAQRYKPFYVALLATSFSKIPVIGVAHAFNVMDLASRRLLFRLMARRAWMIGVSESVARDVVEYCGQSSASRVLALHNCVDVPELESALLGRAEARKRLGLPEAAFVFGNVGRLHKEKDPIGLLRAFAAVADGMPDAHLVYIGEGVLRMELEQTISDLGLQGQAHVLGPVPGAAALFRAFDVYVSNSDREPFGMVLTEAQAARVPIVAADCGGAGEVVAGSGLQFSRAEPHRLSQLLREVYGLSSSELQEIGAQGHVRLIERFSIPAFRKALLSLPPIAAAFK